MLDPSTPQPQNPELVANEGFLVRDSRLPKQGYLQPILQGAPRADR